MSRKHSTETSTTRSGPHHAPQLRPDQCMLSRQDGHRASECAVKKRRHFHLAHVRLDPTLWGWAVFDAMCYTVRTAWR